MLDSADTVELSQVTAKDLKTAGIRGELAEKLLEQQSEGKQHGLQDFVAAAQGRCKDLKCEFETEKGRKVRVKENPKGELVLEKIVENERVEEKRKAEKRDQIDINHASKERLEDLSGVGPTLAKRILDYRKKHGAFKTAEDLLFVKGITANTLKKISPEIQLGTAPKAAKSSTKVLEDGAAGIKFNGRDVVRLASWNLQCFSSAKAANVGVKDVICRAVLENR